jgi:5-methylcytosine-specific restriction enzyme subunit McrC
MRNSSKTVSLIEFQRLCSERTTQSSGCPDGWESIPDAGYVELREFILEAAASGVEVMKLSSRAGRESLVAQNYVGVVTTRSGSTVEILPKVCPDESPADDRVAFASDALRRMLPALRGGAFRNLGRAELATERMPLFELFVSMFVEEVERVVRAGLRSGYSVVDGNERFLRGKLLLDEDMRRNPIDKSRVFVRHSIFDQNRPENRLVKGALIKLNGSSSSESNRRRIRRLLGLMEEVPLPSDVASDIGRLQKDRETACYGHAVGWACIFLEGRTFTSFQGRTVSEALLFPMEEVFEDYVPFALRREMWRDEAKGWELATQVRGHYLFDGPKNEYPLRPDMVLKTGNDRPVVLDTKWKIMDYDDARPTGGDMYQMYAYGKSFNASQVVLVYPTADPKRAGWGRDIPYHVPGAPEFKVRIFRFDVRIDPTPDQSPAWDLMRGIAEDAKQVAGTKSE